MIKFFDKDYSKQALIIDLCENKPQEPLRADAKFAPYDGGYILFVDCNSINPYAQAGRLCSSLGLKTIKLKSVLSLEAYYQFALGLDDLVNEIELILPLSADEVTKISEVYGIVYACRKLADASSAEVYPELLVKNCYEIIKRQVKHGSLSLRLIDRNSPDFEKLNGLRAVGAGSMHSPVLGIIDYIPDGAADNSTVDVALVGKGITFDSGGYDLKSAKFMDTMRTDKTGAVNLAGALALAIHLGTSKHIRLYLCCAQNLVSATSMVPGDIIKYQNGISVEVGNTDAEGRLVLADGLIEASNSGALNIISEATLTGAAKIALGRDMCAVVARNNQVPQSFFKAFDDTLELVWQLPLFNFHDRYIKANRAQWLNTSCGEGAPGVSTAAAFLEKFVSKKAFWLHIDLSSAYLPGGSQFLSSGPTGATIRALASYLSK